MAAPWPHQSPSGQGYAYPSYQQQQQPYQPGSVQYPPLQYVPPVASAQPYAYAPQGPYQQPHPYHQTYSQAPSQVSQKPHGAQPTPPVCYNCGSPNHWAQSCPEPRREVPAGDMSRLNYGPNKRPKYTPPVITKYPVPPQAHIQYGPQAYGGQPYGQSAYPQYHSQYGTPVAMTTYPPQHQQWPPNSAQQHYPPSYPQGKAYQQQTYPTPPSPAVTTSYGPHYHGAVAPQGPPQYPGYFKHSYSHPPNQVSHAPSYSSTSPSVAGPALAPHHSDRRISHDETELGNGRYERPASVQSQALSTGQNSAPMSVDEDDEDDLGMLDIPDIPKYPGPNGETSPKAVGYALPADYAVFESVGGELPAPALEANGCIQSVFVTQDSLNKMLERFIDCGAWEFSEEDPIFLKFNHDSDIVPLDEWFGSHARKPSEEAESGVDQEDGELPPEDQITNEEFAEKPRNYPNYEENQDGSFIRESSSLYSKDTVLPQKPSQAVQGPPLLSGPDHAPGAGRNTEEILAALGVTGVPKPVRAPARPYPPPEASRKVQKPNNNQMYDSEGKSPEGNDHVNQNHDDIHASPNSKPPNSSKATLRDPFDPEDQDPAETLLPPQDVSHPDWPNAMYEQNYKGFMSFPPPPPPPMRKSSTLDGNQRSPTSPGLNQVYRNGYTANGADHTNGVDNGSIKYMANGKPYSPIKLRSERVYDRKRNFESRDSSDDEQGNERRRQVDDVTPKLKRRQPKVAAAYDRRW